MSVLLLVPTIVCGCGGSHEGQVLAEGKNLGTFEASPNPFKFDAAQAWPFVITKIEVFGRGQLEYFPPGCSVTTCSATMAGEWPIVVVSTKPAAPRCFHGSGEDFAACLSPLSVQCSLGDQPIAPTYIWWARDSAGRRQRHGCLYFDLAHPSELAVMGFAPHVRSPPTSFSLVVQGRDVTLRLSR
jgi:hypothetical protein